MKRSIGLHGAWLIIATLYTRQFGVSKAFHDSYVLLAWLFDVGGVYLVSVLLPAIAYYVTLTGQRSEPDRRLQAKLTVELLIVSGSALAAILLMQTFAPDTTLRFVKTNSYFVVASAGAFVASMCLPIVHKRATVLLVAASGSVLSLLFLVTLVIGHSGR